MAWSWFRGRCSCLATVDLDLHLAVPALVTAAAESVACRPSVLFHTNATTGVVAVATAFVVPRVTPTDMMIVVIARLRDRVAAVAVLP